MATYKK